MATARLIPSPSSFRHISGPARIDRRTKRLTARLRAGDIALIDHDDLDGLAARSLAEAHVAAVINLKPFITGKYPNRGPGVLAEAQIPLFELQSEEVFTSLKDGDQLIISPDFSLYKDDTPIAKLLSWTDDKIAEATQAARANLGTELEKFARNTLQYLDADKDLLLDPTDVPEIKGTKIAGRHALVVVRGEGYKEDLALLRPYLRDVKPVTIAVDGGADALLAIGHTPDIILGDMDSVSDAALRCGAQLIVHAYARRGGEAPGLKRIQELGLEAQLFPVPGTSEDAALLLAYEHGADLIVALGTHSNLEDFLDKGRAGMASTFLVRLKVGPRLVDARGVCKLYQPKPPAAVFFAVVLSALFPMVVLIVKLPIMQNILGAAHLWWRLHFH